MKISKEIWKNKEKILIYSILLVILIVVIGIVMFPSVFYDQWIWKYYWGPVVADASGGVAEYNGVVAHEGYTMVSEITYGIILILALYGIYRLIKKLKIEVNWRFALALMPYILFGPVSRVLEDTGYFEEPTIYWYISPLIYLQIAIFAILFLLLGYYLEKKYSSSQITVNKVLFLGGLIFLVPSFYLIAQWILGNRWGSTTGVRFDVFLLVFLCIYCWMKWFVATTIVWKSKSKEKLNPYVNPLNLAMLFGHLMDGITSYISIKDPLAMGLNYAEKHPASNFLLEIWGPLFPIVKFLLIIIVIYVFDVYLKDELKNHMTLVNLLKIVILILGFSPGLRDILRVTMGV